MIGKTMMMTDPRYIPPSERDTLMQCSDDDNMRIVEILGGSVTAYEAELEAHAVFMDERDARQRGLIRRLADAIQEDLEWCEAVGRDPCSTCKLLVEARGVEATNE